MNKWQLSITIATVVSLSITTTADEQETKQDDRDKLSMATITIPGKTSRISTSKEIATVIEPRTTLKPKLCEAAVSLTYYQHDTSAEVNTEIESDTCADHQGRYRIRLFYKPEHGEPKRIDHEAQWSASEGTAKAVNNFPLGSNAELLRVNATIVNCECGSENAAPIER